MQKGQTVLWIIVGVVVLAITGGVLIYTNYYNNRTTSTANPVVSQTPQPTSTPSPVDETLTWKIYKNTKYGFSFKYPEDWLQNKTTTIPFFEEPIIGPVKKGISVNIYENAGNLSAEQFLDQIYYKDLIGNQKTLKDTYMKNVSYRLVTIEGISATQFEPQQPTGSAGYMVWLTKGDIGILLRSNPVEEGKEILSQILSTFKFTQ